MPISAEKWELALPQATSSFGAIAAGDWLYVYGGHIVPTHDYSTAAVSGRFDRINLAGGKAWESLPAGPGLQGMNLAARHGKIYRVGGMDPRNKPDEKADVHSVTTAACFDPATGAWSPLAALPVARSSHDLVVIADKLYAVGGWTMRGQQGNDWLDTMHVLDLSSEQAEWQSIKQPFERRALTAACHQNKLYVLGGFDEGNEARRQVDIYDPASNAWSQGPELPKPDLNGFAPAACAHQGRLYVSVGDGTLYRLSEDAAGWERVATSTPRIVHRLVSHGDRIYILGGAAKGGNLDLVETVTIEKQ